MKCAHGLTLTLALALALGLFPGAGTARAGEEDGWVLGLGSSFAFEDFDGTAGLDFDDSSTSAVQFGYRLNPMFTLEGEYEYVRDFESDTAGISFDIGGWYAGLATKFYPVASSVRPYLMLGAGYMELEGELRGAGLSANIDDHAIALTAGAGLDLHINENWTIELQGAYRRPTSDLRDLNFYTAGAYLRYRF